MPELEKYEVIRIWYNTIIQKFLHAFFGHFCLEIHNYVLYSTNIFLCLYNCNLYKRSSREKWNQAFIFNA